MCVEYIDSWGNTISPYVNLDGKPVERDKHNWPYSYDPYVVWKGNYIKGENETVYSDRLMQWNYEKFNKCCKEVWDNEGQYFSGRSATEIERFLSLYFEKEIELTVIMQGCNVSSGYPYWIFYFKDK